MASRVVTQGLQKMVNRIGNISGQGPIQGIAVDGSTTAFAAGTTNLGSPALLAANTGTVTRTGQTLRVEANFTTLQGNGVLRRVSIHDVPGSSITGTSASLVAGIDGFTLTKTSGFSLTISAEITLSNI